MLLLLSVITDVERQDEGAAGRSISADEWVGALAIQPLKQDSCSPSTQTLMSQGLGAALSSIPPPFTAHVLGTLARHFPGRDPSTQNEPDYRGVPMRSFFKANLW